MKAGVQMGPYTAFCDAVTGVDDAPMMQVRMDLRKPAAEGSCAVIGRRARHSILNVLAAVWRLLTIVGIRRAVQLI